MRPKADGTTWLLLSRRSSDVAVTATSLGPGRSGQTPRRDRTGLAEPWRALLAQGGGAFLHVVAQERQHLVGRRLVKDRPRHPQPAIERPLGQPDGLLRAGGQPVGD